MYNKNSSRKVKIFYCTLIGFVLYGCVASDSTYTLYRNSPVGEYMRLHVATFDSTDGHDYNMENCKLAQQLFQKQENIKTKFWCEKGAFKK